MAHQNWSQASERLKGALQNVGLEVILKAGRADAEYSSRLLGAVDPMSVKHTVDDEAAVERTHPTFFPLLEQWEQHAQAIQALRVGEAFIRLPNDTVRRVKTPTLPAVAVSSQQFTALQEYYLQQYFRPAPQHAATVQPAVPEAPEVAAAETVSIRRHPPDEHPEQSPEAATPDGVGPGTVFARPDRLRRHN